MRIIKTIKDIEILKNTNLINQEVLQEIEEQFKHIYSNLGEGVPIEKFSLIDTGIIVLLEEGDNPKALDEIGLSSEENGLMGVTPEWVQRCTLVNTTLIIACILCNNEYAISIFFENSKFDEEIEEWISENI